MMNDIESNKRKRGQRIRTKYRRVTGFQKQLRLKEVQQMIIDYAYRDEVVERIMKKWDLTKHTGIWYYEQASHLLKERFIQDNLNETDNASLLKVRWNRLFAEATISGSLKDRVKVLSEQSRFITANKDNKPIDKTINIIIEEGAPTNLIQAPPTKMIAANDIITLLPASITEMVPIMVEQPISASYGSI